MKMEVGSLAVGRMGCHVSTETISHKCLFSKQLCQRISRIALPRRSFRRTEETRGADDDNDGAQLHSVFSCDAQLELQNRHGRVLEPALDIPLELRLYPVGSSMPFHCDDCLYAIPQLEFIYTVENDSDSKTVWVDAEGITRAEFTEPNSLLIVRAGAPDGAALTTTSTTTSSSITSTVHLTISTNDDTLATSVPVAGVATEPFGCMHCVTPVNRGSRLILKGVWTLTQERIDDVHLDNIGSKRISKGKRKGKSKGKSKVTKTNNIFDNALRTYGDSGSTTRTIVTTSSSADRGGSLQHQQQDTNKKFGRLSSSTTGTGSGSVGSAKHRKKNARKKNK
eukprot:CAMPEP_0175009140 /NCGR_PEP_ID=MMETSP0005-20121125/7353_1 /TAXON_ID=420556 /ORGANISM="Ochromonas sp., Strain CCMP1393" /LENGTH=337 /DNA_ID=CAMNT_0016264763 /DNA_START=247 /DNA_END=1260 /DNA_ORIENTATION=+